MLICNLQEVPRSFGSFLIHPYNPLGEYPSGREEHLQGKNSEVFVYVNLVKESPIGKMVNVPFLYGLRQRKLTVDAGGFQPPIKAIGNLVERV
jgi:hypothetical protein